MDLDEPVGPQGPQEDDGDVDGLVVNGNPDEDDTVFYNAAADDRGDDDSNDKWKVCWFSFFPTYVD